MSANQVKQFKIRGTSLRALADYAECTRKCRHRMLMEYFGEKIREECCDFTCDYCKDPTGLKRRKEEGLASEEYVSSQSWSAEGYED